MRIGNQGFAVTGGGSWCRYIPPSEYGSKVALRIAAVVAGSESEGAKTAVPAAHAVLADAHLLGLGVAADSATAAAHYRLASVGFGNVPAVASFMFAPTQAKLSLGFMHEFGTGVPQDLNLAKRHYESALEGAGPAWLPPRFAVGALRMHRAWRRTVAAYPLLRALTVPLAAGGRWLLHHSRRLVDPVYAFHVPVLPDSTFTPGNPGHDSFADAPPPSQPLGTSDKLPPPPKRKEGSDGAAPGKVGGSVLPPVVRNAWVRVRDEVMGVATLVQRFLRTMLMLEGGFAPSTAFILALLVLRLVLQFVMEALAANGRRGRAGVAGGNAGAAGDDAGPAEVDDGAVVGDAVGADADGGGAVDVLEGAPSLEALDALDTDDSALPVVEAVASGVRLVAATESLEPAATTVAQECVEPGEGVLGTPSWDAGGSSAEVGQGSGSVADVGDGTLDGVPVVHPTPHLGGSEAGVDQAIQEARQRSVAAAMARMRSQAAASAAEGGSGSGAVLEAGVPAAAEVGVGEQAAASSSAAGVSAGNSDQGGSQGSVAERMRGAGCQQDMDEGDDDIAAAQPDLGIGADTGVTTAAASQGRSGAEDQSFVWAGFGTLTSDTASPPAGFWASGGGAGAHEAAAEPAADVPQAGPSAFSQLASALRGRYVEPSPLSHSVQAPNATDGGGGRSSAAPRGIAFPSFDLCHNKPAPAFCSSSATPAAPPSISLELSGPDSQGAPSAINTRHGSAELSAGAFELGFGSPVSDSVAPAAAFAAFPLAGSSAHACSPGDTGTGEIGGHGQCTAGPEDMHVPPPKHDDDDLPDLDPTGAHTLPSITLMGHQLPVSTGAAFGAVAGIGGAGGVPQLPAPHGSDGGRGPGKLGGGGAPVVVEDHDAGPADDASAGTVAAARQGI